MSVICLILFLAFLFQHLRKWIDLRKSTAGDLFRFLCNVDISRKSLIRDFTKLEIVILTVNRGTNIGLRRALVGVLKRIRYKLCRICKTNKRATFPRLLPFIRTKGLP